MSVTWPAIPLRTTSTPLDTQARSCVPTRTIVVGCSRVCVHVRPCKDEGQDNGCKLAIASAKLDSHASYGRDIALADTTTTPEVLPQILPIYAFLPAEFEYSACNTHIYADCPCTTQHRRLNRFLTLTSHRT